MALEVSSPSRSSGSKRVPMTISRTVGKALADVINKDKDLVRTSSAASNKTGTSSSPTISRAATDARAVAAARNGYRTTRSSLDASRSNQASGKSTPQLTNRPPPTSASKLITRSQTVATSASMLVKGDSSPIKPSEKPKSRASLTFRGLSSALHPKSGDAPPSALPKYKPKSAKDSLGIPRSHAKKRLSDWDGEKAETILDVKTPDEGEDDFVTIERPISPLPRRVTRSTAPVSLSMPPSTPAKRGNLLHKATNSSSSPSPRPPKTAKTSAAPTSPAVRLQSCQSRPSSAASIKPERTTPTRSVRKSPSTSRAKTVLSARRRPPLADSSVSSKGKLESSPRNPFQLPETTGNSLLSPPLSPFLEGVSLDSVDACDVSALLPSVVSPTKPTPAPFPINGETFHHPLRVFPQRTDSGPPQTPLSSRTISTLSTDPRQSVFSLRQLLENSGDLEHLLSQPLPSIFSPDARERLLSFGFSPGFPPAPLPAGLNRPEPQTPCPVPDGRASFTSISQVLFPTTSIRPETEDQPYTAPNQSGISKRSTELDGEDDVELLKKKLFSVERQRTERDARIEDLENQLRLSQEARERDAATLTTQMLDLNKRLKELSEDKEQEAKKCAAEMEGKLRDKDGEWEAYLVRAQRQGLADQERLLTLERRKGCIRSAAAAWECAMEIARSELDLLRSNKRFIQVTLAGLDISMQRPRQ